MLLLSHYSSGDAWPPLWAMLHQNLAEQRTQWTFSLLLLLLLLFGSNEEFLSLWAPFSHFHGVGQADPCHKTHFDSSVHWAFTTLNRTEPSREVSKIQIRIKPTSKSIRTQNENKQKTTMKLIFFVFIDLNRFVSTQNQTKKKESWK